MSADERAAQDLAETRQRNAADGQFEQVEPRRSQCCVGERTAKRKVETRLGGALLQVVIGRGALGEDAREVGPVLRDLWHDDADTLRGIGMQALVRPLGGQCDLVLAVDGLDALPARGSALVGVVDDLATEPGKLVEECPLHRRQRIESAAHHAPGRWQQTIGEGRRQHRLQLCACDLTACRERRFERALPAQQGPRFVTAQRVERETLQLPVGEQARRRLRHLRGCGRAQQLPGVIVTLDHLLPQQPLLCSGQQVEVGVAVVEQLQVQAIEPGVPWQDVGAWPNVQTFAGTRRVVAQAAIAGEAFVDGQPNGVGGPGGRDRGRRRNQCSRILMCAVSSASATRSPMSSAGSLSCRATSIQTSVPPRSMP